jgi:hypothetical protein
LLAETLDGTGAAIRALLAETLDEMGAAIRALLAETLDGTGTAIRALLAETLDETGAVIRALLAETLDGTDSAIRALLVETLEVAAQHSEHCWPGQSTGWTTKLTRTDDVLSISDGPKKTLVVGTQADFKLKKDYKITEPEMHLRPVVSKMS